MKKQQESDLRRIPELDGLRGLAILLVLVYHYIVLPGGLSVTYGTLPAYLLALGKLSWSGVDLFFVLSGFLIGGILIDARDSQNYFKTFYLRRSHRILPIYVVMCSLFWLGAALLAGSRNTAWATLFDGLRPPWYIYATLTQNNWMAYYGSWGPGWLSVTWSLAVEEQFYLTLPFIVWIVKPTRLPIILIIVILAAPLLRIVLFFNHPHGEMATYVLMPCRAEGLMLGVGAALLVRNRSWLAAIRRFLYPALIVFSFGIVLLTLLVRRIGTFPMTAFSYSWIALFYFSILLAALTQRMSGLNRVLRNRALTGLGTIAYGTYLFHPVVQVLSYGFIRGSEPRLSNLADAGVGVLSLGLTLAIAKVSWHRFEKPLVKRGHRYGYKSKPDDSQRASTFDSQSNMTDEHARECHT